MNGIVPKLLSEIHSIGLFFQAILTVATFTGLGVGVLIAFAYELQTKRRAQ